MPITGSLDGVQPQLDVSGLFREWSWDEIFTGTVGVGKYIPKVNDGVKRWVPDGYLTYRVANVDILTGLSNLIQVNPSGVEFKVSTKDRLVGPQDSFKRIYYDNSVTPHVLTVEQRDHIKGTDAKYYRIFKGPVDPHALPAQAISRKYDNSGAYIADSIPLALAGIDNVTVYSIWALPTCHTNEHLVNNEVLTIVVYSDSGIVVSTQEVVVVNTTFIGNALQPGRVITGISLRTQFSSTTPGVIELPQNLLNQALMLQGVVSYSDGSTDVLPVDGTKFSIWGIDNIVATSAGDITRAVLTYHMSVGEAAASGTSTNNNAITRRYDFVTIAGNPNYTAKLFPVPYWAGVGQGYRLKWFFMNMSRGILADVTSYVQFSSATGPFNTTEYGTKQIKTVTLNLSSVSLTYGDYVHVQTVEIYLKSAPTASFNLWEIATVTGGDMYGLDLKCTASRINGNNWNFNITSGFASLQDWLDNIYIASSPLWDSRIEAAPPVPTHFELDIDGSPVMFPIAMWNTQLQLTSPLVAEYRSIAVRFWRDEGSGPIIACGIAPLTIDVI